MTEKLIKYIGRTKRAVESVYGETPPSLMAQDHLMQAAGYVGESMAWEEDEPPVDVPPVDEPPVDVPPVDPPDPDDDWEGETNVFKNGAYEFLSDVYVNLLADSGVEAFPPLDRYVDTRAIFVNGYDTADTFDLAQLNGLRVLGNSQRRPGGDTLLWGAIRGYGCFGDVDDVMVVRSGDYDEEREGHAFYCALFGSSNWSNIATRQNLGQSGQFTFRPNTTRIRVGNLSRPDPKSSHYINGQLDPKKYGSYLAGTEWWKGMQQHQRQHTMTVLNWNSVDDSIGGTKAGRSSNPFSFFNPGISLDIQGMYIACDREVPFYNNAAGPFRSRGGFMTWKSYGCTVPELKAQGFQCFVQDPDREEFRFHGVEDGLLDAPEIVRNNGDKPGRITVYDNCEDILITNPVNEVMVSVHSAAKDTQHKMLESVMLKPGQEYHWVK